MNREFYESALEYHRKPKPGKLEISSIKPLANQRDLSLAYSPGVAAACHEIARDEAEASTLTGRANLVAVVTNGTAVLGLGNIGPLASKPVMEGKAVLFKKFANINVFDIEINENDPDKLVDIIASLEPTFGGINLEDIKAPECFMIERKLQERMKIPVFHDDQHGTAIIVGAAILNSMRLVEKNIDEIKVVTSGAGAAALACLNLLERLGVRRENIFITDIDGVVYKGRTVNMDPDKEIYAQDTPARTLQELLHNADIFLGLSVGNILTPEMLEKMAPRPLILALANPTPEIEPGLAKIIRSDAIVATGRSDFPNQVNNVLCFPFIFRGALDVGATCINMEMKLACVHALANLARAELSDVVSAAYGNEDLRFGNDYIIPKPFDPRLIVEIAPAVAKAAMETGVATRPIEDLEAYKQNLSQYVYRSGLTMKPIFSRARAEQRRVVYAEGEDERILRAVQIVVDEEMARPILIGRRRVVERRCERLGLRLKIDQDYELVDPEKDARYPLYWQTYHQLLERKGVTPDYARMIVRTNTTVIAALMVYRGEADAMLCGPVGRYKNHLEVVRSIIGHNNPMEVAAALNILALQKGTYFFADGYVNDEPSARELAYITLLAAEHVRLFGVVPKIALVSHSSFGTSCSASARKMQEAVALVHAEDPHLEVEGEMHADAAFDEKIRLSIFPNSRLKGEANLVIMPSIDAANIAFNMIKGLGEGQSIGPLLMGVKKSAHILTPSATVRGIFNMTAFAVVDALRHEAKYM
jgi:malate dehydrogenase (oxaloacetate-decarboxylating)(NADP+)